jgi:hypothetical protein
MVQVPLTTWQRLRSEIERCRTAMVAHHERSMLSNETIAETIARRARPPRPYVGDGTDACPICRKAALPDWGYALELRHVKPENDEG